MIFKLSEKSSINIIEYRDVFELSKLTSPFIKKGIIGLSGGSTYDKLFSIWANEQLDISEAIFLPVDERVVPITHKESNWRNATEKFFIPLNAQKQSENIAISLSDYDRLFNKFFLNRAPIFDAIFLGVGDDGHTASLFPNSNDVDNMADNYLSTVSPKGIKQRVTLSVKVISSAKNIITILSGEGKEYLLKSLIELDRTKPFISLLSQCKYSTLYLPTDFYKKFKEQL